MLLEISIIIVLFYPILFVLWAVVYSLSVQFRHHLAHLLQPQYHRSMDYDKYSASAEIRPKIRGYNMV